MEQTSLFYTRLSRFLLLLSILILVTGYSNTLYGKKLNAYFSYSTFYSPEEGPYIETYLTVVGNSVLFEPTESNMYKGTIQVIFIFRTGDEIINFDKYELNTPEIKDTINFDFSFFDQQRYALASGQYDFEIQISDINSTKKPFIHVEEVLIDYPAEEIRISGMQLVESFKKTQTNTKFSKNGYELIPYITNFFPENKNKLTFYSEIYNTNKVLGEGEKLLISYFIKSLDYNKPLNEFVRYKKEQTSSIHVVFSEFDITNLRSGNYHLVIEARDKNNKVLAANMMFFQRSNPSLQLTAEQLANIEISTIFAGKITSMDTLREYLEYLKPIASEHEHYFISSMANTSEIETLQRYFYKFWQLRNEINPEQEWLLYLNEVNKVNLAYSTQISKGYETDRGRIYLKYGPPNAISESYNEPATYPYEIWHYYTLKNGQRNKKFVFYTKDIVTNDFVQLHSDVAGELSNYRWQQVIYSRVDAGFNLDEGVKEDTWGGNSKKYFDIPR